MAKTGWRKTLLGLLVLGVCILGACAGSDDEPGADSASEGGLPMTIELTSSAFRDKEAIPAIYSCDGEDVSPPLQWRNVPADTVSLALIMDDPDAPVGTWVHWVIYDMPPTATGLPERVSSSGTISGGGTGVGKGVGTGVGTQGNNSWNRSGYGGPCPPSGTHRYFFKLYALDSRLDLDAGATKDELLEAMTGHILGQGQLMGTYQR